MSLIAACLIVGSGVAAAAAWRWMGRRRRADEAAEAAMPRRTPGARYVVWGDPDAPAPSHDEHIEAIRALCCSSSVYTHSRLAAHEPEVAYLAELLLELDDQSPKPAGPVED